VNITDRKVLVLGGYGLVGTAVSREILARKPKELQIHSLRAEESESAKAELAAEFGDIEITTSSGDIFGLVEEADRDTKIRAQVGTLRDEKLPQYLLYQLLSEKSPDVVIDCVNTATAIAYSDIFQAARNVRTPLEAGDSASDEQVRGLLEALYMPRLIRHIQVLYRGMQDAGSGVYVKVGTSGTGGMGLNVPYTHSEEKPSSVLLSKSAVAGAHSMLLFLMARTPDAPITKEIKPAAAIAWKKIGRGPISRKGKPIRISEGTPQPIPETFSSYDSTAAVETDAVLDTAYIDTGENGLFSMEEFALLTTAEQMEFVTPEEIAQYLVFEIEGGNTGYDIINALDNAVLGPTYRAGFMRGWALSRMQELEDEGETRSIAFEMLGPPRNSKLLFECHLLREAYGSMEAVRKTTADEMSTRLDELVRSNQRLANEVISVGVPIVLSNGEYIRGTEVIVPKEANEAPVDPQTLEKWIADGWADIREANCQRWIDRFRAIHDEIESIPEGDSSSRFMRNHRFWADEQKIQPGKIAGWILSVEEKGARFKS